MVLECQMREVLTVGVVVEVLRQFAELFRINEVLSIGDFFDTTDHRALTFFDSLNEA